MSFIKINETTSVNTSNIMFMKTDEVKGEPALTIAFIGGFTLSVLEKDLAMSPQNTWAAIVGSQLRK